MATLPGALILGDYHVQGGLPAISGTNLPTLSLSPFRDPRLFGSVPSNPDGTQHGAPPFSPWYEGSASSTNYAVLSATSNTVTVTGTPFTPGTLVGRPITVFNSPTLGSNQVRTITANTSSQLTVGSAWDATPAVGRPFRVGTGRFLPHAAPSMSLIEVIGAEPCLINLGSSWQAGGLGIGLDATMVRRLFERVWPVAPYFKVAKFAGPDSLANAWKVGGATWTSLLAELPRIAAAALPDVIRWDLVLCDLSSKTIELAPSQTANLVNYGADLAAMLTLLKSSAALSNPSWFVPGTPKVQIVNHHPELWGTTAPGAAFFVRQAHAEYARVPANNCALLDMAGARFVGSDLLAHSTILGEGKYYRTVEYFDLGERSPDLYLRQTASVPATPGAGLPVYGMLGDSICAGQTPPQFVQLLESDELIGDEPGTALPAGFRIYNRGSASGEPYDPQTNANTSGTVNGLSGPELGAIAELRKLHPDGFLLVKRGSNGAALVENVNPYSSGSGGRWAKAANEHYPEFLADLAGAFDWVHSIGRVPDFRGLLIPSLGQNDCSAVSGGTAAAAALAQFVADVAADFTTRTSGKQFPIAWGLPLLNTPIGSNDQVAALRSALQTLQSTNAQVRTVNCDDLERDRSPGDLVHDTPLSAIARGRRIVQALTTVALN